jgi:hypothetical protein
MKFNLSYGILIFAWCGLVPCAALGQSAMQDTTQNAVDAATAAAMTYVHTYGSDDKLLDVDEATGNVTEFHYLGTATDVQLCNGLSIVQVNFINNYGREVTSNFVINDTAQGPKVTYQSFGRDSSLARVTKAGCKTYRKDTLALRLVTYAE